MKVTIVREDGLVGVDGMFFAADLSSLPGNLHAVQWNGTKGHEEWLDKPNTHITDISAYKQIIDDWKAKKDLVDAKKNNKYYGMTTVARETAIKEELRQKDINVARSSSGLKDFTVAQGEQYIDKKMDLTEFDAAGDFASVKAALRVVISNQSNILKKILPYIQG